MEPAQTVWNGHHDMLMTTSAAFDVDVLQGWGVNRSEASKNLLLSKLCAGTALNKFQISI